MSAPTSNVLDHLRAPRNAGTLETPDAVGYADLDGRAPRMTLFLQIRGNCVEKALFQTFGCGYAIACCSALTELVTGLLIEDCLVITAENIAAALGGLPPGKQFCAELAVRALRDALTKWQVEKTAETPHD